MKKNVFLLMFLIVPVIAISQNEIDGNIDSKSDILFEPRILYSIPTLNSAISSFKNNLFSHRMAYSDAELFNNFLMRKIILNDSINSSRILFSPFSQQMIQPGLGYYNNMGVSSIWIPIDKLFIEGTTFISVQNTLYSREILYGANGVLSYNFTDKLQLKL